MNNTRPVGRPVAAGPVSRELLDDLAQRIQNGVANGQDLLRHAEPDDYRHEAVSRWLEANPVAMGRSALGGPHAWHETAQTNAVRALRDPIASMTAGRAREYALQCRSGPFLTHTALAIVEEFVRMPNDRRLAEARLLALSAQLFQAVRASLAGESEQHITLVGALCWQMMVDAAYNRWSASGR